MAKKIPKKQKLKSQQNEKPSFVLQFLFPSLKTFNRPTAYLTDFTDKIKPELISRSGVICVEDEGSDPEESFARIRAVEPGSMNIQDLKELFREGYVALLESLPLERQINPNEFLQLSLPKSPEQPVYYSVSYKGKTTLSHAGLILPASIVSYLLKVYGIDTSLNQGSIQRILKKLGFEKKDVTIHQEGPFNPPDSKDRQLLARIRLNLTWNTTIPLREARLPQMRKMFFSREHPLFRFAFFFTALAIFIILPILSLDAGLSGDDEKHYQHAVKVYRYFTEDDPAALDDSRNKLNYYGQSFDFFTHLLIRLFGLEDTPYEARHVMVALAGAAAILVTGLLAKIFAGYRGGILALVLMFLSPRFLGHAFNNPMDVPFALGYIFTIYHTILFLRKLPRISTRSAIYIALGIGWTNGIRIGGLVLVPYLFMFAGLYLLVHKWPWKFFSAGWWRFAMKGLFSLLLISVAGYILSLLTWPYALQDIINHPIQAFKVMSNIQVSIRVLYDGLVQWSDHLPWHYIPKNVFLTVPVIILLGWFASSFSWRIRKEERQGFWYFLLWFTVLFPVLFIIRRESNVYGGWRHMMFIYPSMLALSAIALSEIAGLARKKWIQITLLVLLAVGLIHPLKHVIKNHPNTYIYFNEWAGGINSTYGKFETDYYTNSLGPATDYFIEELLPELEVVPEDPIKVVSNANINYYFRNYRDKVSPFYSRYYDRGKYDWDYAILYCNYIHPFQLNNGLWPPKNTIHEIKVDDVVVAAIIERKNKDDHLGSILLAEGMAQQDGSKLNAALNHLERAVEYDPNNEAAYLELGNTYSAFLRFDDARATMDHLLEIYPGYDKALNLKGYSYLIESEVKQDKTLIDEAIRIINMALKVNYKFYSGYYNLGLCYATKQDFDNAIYHFQQAIRFNGKFKSAYEKLAEVYEFRGDNEMANRVRAQLNRLP